MQITLLGKHQREDADSPNLKAKKAFLRKTARGAVVKVIREHYLRPDVPCGSQICEECSDLYEQAPTLTGERSDASARPVLSSKGRDPTVASKNTRHYLVLDTNILLHQMDALEASELGSDIVILQTVLEEVRHRSMPLYNRAMSLIGDETRRFFIFANEARQETFVARQDGETPNDRNDRAIRKASKWYATHLASALASSSTKAADWVSVVLITNDSDNLRKARQDGVNAVSFKTYLESLPTDKSNKLLDLMSAESDEDVKDKPTHGRKPVLFAEYLSSSSIMAGVKSGKLHQGHFYPNRYNYLEANVKVPKYSKPVLIVGRTDMNRATAGDSVAIEILPESEWKRPTDHVAERVTRNNDNPEGSDDQASASEDEEEEEKRTRAEQDAVAELQPTGKVVGVLKRAWRSYVCVLDRDSVSPGAMDSLAPQHVFAIPVDRNIPKIRIRTRQVASLKSQKFLAAIDSWDVVSRHPNGHFVRALGQVDSKEAEIEALLLEFDVPYRPFPKAILDCLPAEGESWKVPPKSDCPEWKGREDLRDLLVCSIDPIGCQDIDDALHARALPNGNIEAGVHIADVSYFVRPNNPMDAEATARGTTVYLVDKRIDMLPPLLGTNLCSLRPYVERLAFSVIWEMDDKANIVNVRFTKSVIASKEAFSYEAAQIRKDDQSLQDDLTNSIRLLNTLAIKLKQKRMEAGALNLASPEVKIHLDSAETSGPIDVEQKKLLETNSLVEEFMLLANISVAQRIYDQFPQTAVLRRHLPPPPANFEVLSEVLMKRRGFKLDTSSSGALADSLDRCVDPNLPTFNTLVRIMATRCMLPAEYFCSGTVPKDTFGHYGLASPIYTHFTSPIRRYADILAHRELYAAISETPLHTSMHSTSHVEDIMDNINKRHRLAQQAGRASVEFYVTLALRDKQQGGKVSVIEEAYVIRAFTNGLAVFVSKFGLEGLITFKKDISYNAEEYEITLQQDGKSTRIGVFDKVKVEITVDKDEHTQKGRVKMYLVEPVRSRLM